MKEVVRTAVVQFRPRWLEIEANLAAIEEATVRVAQEHPTDLVVFPELAATGYPPPDESAEALRGLREVSSDLPGAVGEALGSVARQTGAHLVVGTSELEDGDLYNTSALFGPDGKILGAHRKVHLWGTEAFYFRPGPGFGITQTSLGRVGLSVCYDSKFPGASGLQARNGAEILVCVFAFAESESSSVETLRFRAATRAWENSVYYVAANQLGKDVWGIFSGGSVVADPCGRILGNQDAREPVVRADLRADLLAVARGEGDAARDARPETYLSIIGGQPE